MKEPANLVIPTPAVIRIEGNVQWQWRVASGGNYVAMCDPLRITLQAASWSELMEEISTTLDALLKDLVETNEFDQFMQEHGWRSVETIQGHSRDMRFEVPFSILPCAMTGTNGSARSLHQ
jgi:hypothetical protein